MAAASLWNNSSRTVCVMDASGRLGSALVHRLLQRGYTVHAAVHSRDELQRYKIQSSENKKLRVFHSDTMDYHSILEALKGCCALFYSFELPSDNPTYDEWLCELEVRAAHNMLEACAQTDTIDKVVFTSSATAIVWRDHQLHDTLQSDMDERNWSDVNFLKKFKLWHGLSKTLAEKTAWALAMDRGVNMVSINAGLLMRADMTIEDPYLLGAAHMFKDGVFVVVDLEFLVDAHVCVLEEPSTYGRYLCFNRVINSSDDVDKLATTLLPSSSSSLSSNMLDDDRYYHHQQRISNEKLSKIMVDFEGGPHTSSLESASTSTHDIPSSANAEA